ncbi:MAG: hypothetical protein RLZ33_3089 [Bacteroidota bacterium]|jgi:uncharacterized protein YdeI (YjbR/CyaY-like superfamily)
MNPAIDAYMEELTQWREEMKYMRKIVLECNLLEEQKWGQPCYCLGNKNIVLIHGFKDYCALLFMKGSLLSDTHNLLIQQTENVQAGRQIRFNSLHEIIELEPILKAYIFEAIEVEKAGVKVPMKKHEDFIVPEELTAKFAELPELKDAFYALTPGRQRAYILHFSGSKNATTRIARIDKYIPRIMKGKGITDCTCGLSKRMPNCDGSHKQLEKG